MRPTAEHCPDHQSVRAAALLTASLAGGYPNRWQPYNLLMNLWGQRRRAHLIVLSDTPTEYTSVNVNPNRAIWLFSEIYVDLKALNDIFQVYERIAWVFGSLNFMHLLARLL